MQKIDQSGIGHVALIISVVVVGVVGIVGWRVWDASNSSTSQSVSTQDIIVEASQLPNDVEGIKPLEEITALITAAAPDESIKGLSLESEDGVLVYRVLLESGTILVFNATDGTRLADASVDDQDESSTEALPSDYVPGLSLANAIKIARQQFPDKRVAKVEVEKEDGVVVFSVRFTDRTRVEINATTGAIESEQDSDEDESASDSNDSRENESESDNGGSSQDSSEDDAESLDDESSDHSDDSTSVDEKSDDRGGSNSGRD